MARRHACRRDSLPILVTLEPAGSGWRGSVDVPSQYALGYPLTDVRADSAGIAFAFPDVLPAATFSGALEGGRIGGRFAGESRADTLHGTFELWRRPTRTDPYITESARFRNGDLELVGTLLRPRAPGPHPAVVLVHGSGPQTRDSRRCRARRPCGPACARTWTTIQLPSWKR